MNGPTQKVFAVLAAEDRDRVRPILDRLGRESGLSVWAGVGDVSPGSNFTNAIAQAISRAACAVAFISPGLAASRYAQLELISLHEQGRPIVPVVLAHGGQLPLSVLHILEPLRSIDLSASATADLGELVARVREACRMAGPPVVPAPGSHAEQYARHVADAMAHAARRESPSRQRSASPPTSVFIVHGHDEALLQEVEEHLSGLGVESVVLGRIGGAHQSLFQKFLEWGADTRFAIVLLSADDLGVARAQYEAVGVGERALQFRARQNVLLEMGFFYGHLGWESVFVLCKRPDKVFPNFEYPSDLNGVVFDMVDASGRWKPILEDKLREAGFGLK